MKPPREFWIPADVLNPYYASNQSKAPLVHCREVMPDAGPSVRESLNEAKVLLDASAEIEKLTAVIEIYEKALDRITGCCFVCTVCGSCEAKDALEAVRKLRSGE